MMIKSLIYAALLFGGPALVPAGTITGHVTAAPPAHAGSPGGGGDAYASRRYKFVEQIDYDRLRDFVISIDQPVPGVPAPTQKKTVTTTQRDANFDPHVLPVAVGTTVLWPNEDDIFHNVFSMSEAKPFDLGYYKKEKVPEVLFDQVGRVDVFCAIHSRMHCIILVVPNPFFAVADAHGNFEINNVPAGTYKLRAWHERLPAKTLSVNVPETGAVRVDFVLSVGELPKY